MFNDDTVLVYAHIGDLHITTEGARNYTDFRNIVAELNRWVDELDFVILPGDNADDALPDQYRLASEVLDRLLVPLHILTGDHDMSKARGAERCGLANFYAGLAAARPLPYAATIAGVRCLFLDMCGPGQGHLDFRIGASQLRWLADELHASQGGRCIVFMHTYPADITDPFERAALVRLFARPEVRLVDLGHTHYNELANDGAKIYAATRSTGQIEEADGQVGYAIVTLDRNVVSWRFRALDDRRPMVLITAPADRRLATRSTDPDHHPRTSAHLRARILSHRPIRRLRYATDGAAPIEKTGDDLRHLDVTIDLDGARSITVEATDVAGVRGFETIQLAREDDFVRFRAADGSDADRLDRWIERGILGTQLGPNRNGHGW